MTLRLGLLAGVLLVLVSAAPAGADVTTPSPRRSADLSVVSAFVTAPHGITLAAGEGASRQLATEVPGSERRLCRLHGHLDVTGLPQGASGTISMAIGQRTCLQILVGTRQGKPQISYLTLLGSGTLPVPSGRTDVDLTNFAQDAAREPSDLVSVSVDPELVGVALEILAGTGVLGSTAPTRELEIGLDETSGADGGLTLSVAVERAGRWKGPSGTLSAVLTDPDDGRRVASASTRVSSPGSTTVDLAMRDVPNGTYVAEVSADGFNGPAKVWVMSKSPAPPWTLVVPIGAALVLAGVLRPLLAGGRRTQILAAVMILAAAAIAWQGLSRYRSGTVTWAAPSAQKIDFGDTARDDEDYPPRTINGALQIARQGDWADDLPGRALVYDLATDIGVTWDVRTLCADARCDDDPEPRTLQLDWAHSQLSVHPRSADAAADEGAR